MPDAGSAIAVCAAQHTTVMHRHSADPIERIREFAQGGAHAAAQLDAHRTKSSAAVPGLFQPSRSKRPVRYDFSADRHPEPSELEMCRLACRYGYVVRLDHEEWMRHRPAVKLFRFGDRRSPEEVFASFALALEWLAQRPLAGRPSVGSRSD